LLVCSPGHRDPRLDPARGGALVAGRPTPLHTPVVMLRALGGAGGPGRFLPTPRSLAYARHHCLGRRGPAHAALAADRPSPRSAPRGPLLPDHDLEPGRAWDRRGTIDSLDRAGADRSYLPPGEGGQSDHARVLEARLASDRLGRQPISGPL